MKPITENNETEVYEEIKQTFKRQIDKFIFLPSPQYFRTHPDFCKIMWNDTKEQINNMTYDHRYRRYYEYMYYMNNTY